MGCLVTFWQGMNYIIDCYGFYSKSAIAVNTFVRSIAGAGLPLFAPAMYHNLSESLHLVIVTIMTGIFILSEPIHRSRLGDVTSRLPMRCIHASATAVLYLRGPNTKEIKIHAYWISNQK